MSCWLLGRWPGAGMFDLPHCVGLNSDVRENVFPPSKGCSFAQAAGARDQSGFGVQMRVCFSPVACARVSRGLLHASSPSQLIWSLFRFEVRYEPTATLNQRLGLLTCVAQGSGQDELECMWRGEAQLSLVFLGQERA